MSSFTLRSVLAFFFVIQVVQATIYVRRLVSEIDPLFLRVLMVRVPPGHRAVEEDDVPRRSGVPCAVAR